MNSNNVPRFTRVNADGSSSRKPDIEDAEWEDVGEAIPPPRKPTWWDDAPIWAKLLLVIVLPLLLISTCAESEKADTAQNGAPAQAITDKSDEARSAAQSSNSNVLVSPETEAATTDQLQPGIPQLHKGQAYSVVREKLLASGFRPAHFPPENCIPYGTEPGQECHDRPEIDICSGTGQGFCSGIWLRGDMVLSALVAEGPDGVYDDSFIQSRKELEENLSGDELSTFRQAASQ